MPSLEHTVASVPEGTINLERTYYLADGDTIRIAEWPGVVVVTESYVQGYAKAMQDAWAWRRLPRPLRALFVWWWGWSL
jgi:hypothetical protein